jgi:hypothetical protein
VLDAYRRIIDGDPPPARILAIRGYEFELGAPLSPAAAENLQAAVGALDAVLREPQPGSCGQSLPS